MKKAISYAVDVPESQLIFDFIEIMVIIKPTVMYEINKVIKI